MRFITIDYGFGEWMRQTDTMWIFLFVVFIAALFNIYDFQSYVPVLSTWEHFHYQYMFGAVEPNLSFRVAPRANVGGQGYALVDAGYWLSNIMGGHSLGNFRMIMQFYAFAIAGLMVVIFSRWFGILPAILGTMVIVFSPGFVVFASQTLPMWPTLLLILLFTERFQIFMIRPNHIWLNSTLGLWGALLLTHYAIGRYYLVLLLALTFGAEFLRATMAFDINKVRVHFYKKLVINYLFLITCIVCFLIIINPKNAADLLNFGEILFPNDGDEIEFAASKLLPTLLSNCQLLLASMVPYLADLVGFGVALQHSPEVLLHSVYPFFFDWHLPFLAIGAVVLIYNLIKSKLIFSPKYYVILVMCMTTLGLPLFSESTGDPPIDTFSPYRIVTAYIAFASLAVIAIAWALSFFGTKQLSKQVIAITVVMMVTAASFVQILQMRDDWLAGALQRPAINKEGNGFADFPIAMEYGTDKQSYLQSRYLKLSYLVKEKIECEADKPDLITLHPSLLLSDGRYHGHPFNHHLIQQYNDLSGLMVLYLREIGVDAMYIIYSSEGDRGKIYAGEGYAGKSRVFSGPIKWQKNSIEYISVGSPVFTKKGGSETESTIYIAFSEVEAAAVKIMNLANSELQINSLADLYLADVCERKI